MKQTLINIIEKPQNRRNIICCVIYKQGTIAGFSLNVFLHWRMNWKKVCSNSFLFKRITLLSQCHKKKELSLPEGRPTQCGSWRRTKQPYITSGSWDFWHQSLKFSLFLYSFFICCDFNEKF